MVYFSTGVIDLFVDYIDLSIFTHICTVLCGALLRSFANTLIEYESMLFNLCLLIHLVHRFIDFPIFMRFLRLDRTSLHRLNKYIDHESSKHILRSSFINFVNFFFHLHSMIVEITCTEAS